MRKAIVCALASLAIAGATVASRPATAAPGETCGSGYIHATIGGHQKCLRRGEFCSYQYRKQYHRYGFNCVLLPPSETYHLEPR